jgi:hypothetical protein
VDGAAVRLGVLQGEFHWHRHEQQDEFFLVLEGRMQIELEGREAVELGPRQAFITSRGPGALSLTCAVNFRPEARAVGASRYFRALRLATRVATSRSRRM